MTCSSRDGVNRKTPKNSFRDCFCGRRHGKEEKLAHKANSK
jgi:hypothetical protein